MKKINLKGLDMAAYTETLNNGLEVFMIPYENKKNYFISYATRFGSDVLEFTDDKKKNHKPPLGIAHFLEHKMFEEESGIDPFTFFSESGTDCNASTSFDNTQYICWGNKEFNKNLRYLLQYVSHPYYTDENVEKEKGIIAEEINMYEDIPDFKLEMKLRECIYKNSPRRIDIAGSVEEIYKITKEDLYACYNNFYIPSNMFVLIVGNFDKEIALEIIKDELDTKVTTHLPKIKQVKEPTKVNISNLNIKGNIEVPKIALGLKIDKDKLELEGFELDLYLSMLTNILFGAASIFREKVRKSKILNGLYTEWETYDNFKTFYLMASTIEPEELIKEVKSVLEKTDIDEDSFNRIKKVWISREIKAIDSIDCTVDNSYNDILNYKKIIPNKLDIIKNMKYKVLKDLIKKIDFKNISVVKMDRK